MQTAKPWGLGWLLGVARNADIYRGGGPSAESVVTQWMMRAGIDRPGMTWPKVMQWSTAAAQRRQNAERHGMHGLRHAPKSFPALQTMTGADRDTFTAWLVALARDADSLIFAGVEAALVRLTQ